MTATLVLAE